MGKAMSPERPKRSAARSKAVSVDSAPTLVTISQLDQTKTTVMAAAVPRAGFLSSLAGAEPCALVNPLPAAIAAPSASVSRGILTRAPALGNRGEGGGAGLSQDKVASSPIELPLPGNRVLPGSSLVRDQVVPSRAGAKATGHGPVASEGSEWPRTCHSCPLGLKSNDGLTFSLRFANGQVLNWGRIRERWGK